MTRAHRPGFDASRSKSATLLLVANYPPDVGFAWWLMENFWVHAAEVGKEAGLAPLLVYPKDGPLPPAIRDAELETSIVEFPGSGARSLLRSLKLVRDRNVEVVYLTDRPFTSWTYALLRLAGVKLIINHDHTPGDRPDIAGLKGLVKMAWRRGWLINSDLQMCVSPLIQERAVRNARIPARRTTVVQNGIPPIQCQDDPAHVHSALGIPSEAKVCVTVCRAHPYKRVDFVIEVARHCIAELGIQDLHFVHCGDGPDLDRLDRLRAEAGLSDHFTLAGRRTDVPQILCSSDYALHAARGEAFSLAILEYMSAGLAVLVPDIPTVRQAIEDERTGLVYPDGDARAAAEQLAAIHRDHIYARTLGSAAAESVERDYSLSTMNERFRSVMRQMLLRSR